MAIVTRKLYDHLTTIMAFWYYKYDRAFGWDVYLSFFAALCALTTPVWVPIMLLSMRRFEDPVFGFNRRLAPALVVLVLALLWYLLLRKKFDQLKADAVVLHDRVGEKKLVRMYQRIFFAWLALALAFFVFLAINLWA